MSSTTWAGALMLCALASAIAGQAHRSTALAAAGPNSTPLPSRLADTGLFAPGSHDAIAPRNHAFAPQYPLWSDGLEKARWVYLPPRTTIDISNPHEWVFPVGTRLWKQFSLDGRKVETRMLWRASARQWLQASYAWNEAGTDAVLAPDEGVAGVIEVARGRRHSIPSRTDCNACHAGAGGGPLGFNALQLSPDRDPDALHAEPLRPGMLTLGGLIAQNLIAPPRPEWLTNPPRIATANSATRASLGYLAANCGMCHNGRGEIAALGPVIRADDLLRDGDAVARRLMGQPTAWQIPGLGEGESVLVQPGKPGESALLVRMRSRSPSSQMPPLGTAVRDQKAVDFLTRWVQMELVRDR